MEPQLIKKEPLGKDFFINVSPHHTFGTDAVLLSNFASARKKEKAVDLGTGCGIIPFLMLRDNKSLDITIYDIPLELFVETEDSARVSNGVYSVKKNKCGAPFKKAEYQIF